MSLVLPPSSNGCCRERVMSSLEHLNCLGKAPRGILKGGVPTKWPNSMVPVVVERAFSPEDKILIATVTCQKKSLCVSFFLYKYSMIMK
jgi:hypothetical protein